MRSPFLKLTVLAIGLALVGTGCGKKRKDYSAESLDSLPSADTADVEPSLTAELPPIDTEQPYEESPSAPAPEYRGSGSMDTYTVQRGDTLMKIAFTLYGDISQWKSLYSWNKESLRRANQLEPGTQLKYERPADEPLISRNGEPYLIKKGDTLASIADEIYAKRSFWKKLWANNRQLIHDPHRIYAGFYIYYQITEKEKQLAEAIRAKRASNPDPVPVSDPDPNAAGANAGGLGALTAPRAPASAPSAPAVSENKK